MAGANVPRLVMPAAEEGDPVAEFDLRLPPLDVRQALNAQDPWSSVMCFDVSYRVVTARMLGVRMCLHCPHCNNEGQRYSCQNKFGNNARIFGGTAGFCDGLGTVLENQGEGTPHGHGVAIFVTPYQHRTLLQIHEMIEAQLLDVESIKRFSEHLHREDHYDLEAHQAALPELEKDWKQNYAGREHQALSVKPSYFGQDPTSSTWSKVPS